MMAVSRRKRLRSLLRPGAATIVPGASNALAARIVVDLGFECVYVTGAGVANSYLGIPDNGLVTCTELAAHVAAIRDVFPGPVLVDADTGFGNALNAARTTRTLERAGADALQVEDQVFPKRCGHFGGKEVVPTVEMMAKIKAMVDAREDPDLPIIARTDALAVEGFAAALDRAAAYREAGADVTFIEAPTSVDQMAEIPRRLPWPQIANIVVGGVTPELRNAELQKMGFAGVLYANTALQAAMRGMLEALGRLRREGWLGAAAADLLVGFEERQRLVGKPAFDALEAKYRVTD